MNNTQVAKVVHEATRALGETTGAEPLPAWETLTEPQQTTEIDQVAHHLAGYRRHANVALATAASTDSEKLKYYLANGIVVAFLLYEETPATVTEALAEADRQLAAANTLPPDQES